MQLRNLPTPPESGTELATLALGTVQFGLDYGAMNENGELSDAEVREMLELAHEVGITLFDTAADYGSSQVRLGELSLQEKRYVTKFSLPGEGQEATPANIFADSLEQLRVRSLYGLLFHKVSDLRDPRREQAFQIMSNAVQDGVVEKVGVSVYNREDLELAVEAFPKLNLVQLPANLLDFDLLNSSLVAQLKAKGVEIHIRSVFLQGVLLSNPDKLSDYFKPLLPALRVLHEISEESGRSLLELALGKVRHHPAVDAVIVGALSAAELGVIAKSWNSATSVDGLELPAVPKELVDPRNWPAGKLRS